MGAGTYRDLRVWSAGMDLIDSIYDLTARFPDDERFGLTSQMRRASISIVANVAEGWVWDTVAISFDACRYREAPRWSWKLSV